MTREGKSAGSVDSECVPLTRVRDRARSLLAALIDELSRCGAAEVHEGMSMWTHHQTLARPSASGALGAGQTSMASDRHPCVNSSRSLSNPNGEEKE